MLIAGIVKGQDKELPEYKVNNYLLRVAAGTCASPDGPDKLIASPPPDYNYLNDNGYCYIVSPAVKDYDGCFTMIAGATSVNFNAGYNSSGCNGGLNINYVRLYTTAGCVLINSNAIGTVTGLTIGVNYTWCIGLKCTGSGPGFSTFCPYYQNISTLPIELTYFNGYMKSCGVNYLMWETATENNNDRFEIERSFDGVSFEKIVIIKGAGNSITNKKYNFVDTNPRQELNYYRLRQVDYNGKSEVSSIISIDNSCDKNVTILKTVNLLGQEVGFDYYGVIIIYRSDNTIIKRFQNN
jgi:hypothetical protein